MTGEIHMPTRTPGYVSPRVDNSMGLGRGLTILLETNLWKELDLIARRKDKSKTALLRPVISNYLATERAMTASYTLPFPPSSNNMFFNTPNRGRAKSKEYKAWQIWAGSVLKGQKPITFTERVDISVDLDERERGDADNRYKAISDLLVAHGVIPDDSKKHVRRVSIGWAAVEGCVVNITAVGE